MDRQRENDAIDLIVLKATLWVLDDGTYAPPPRSETDLEQWVAETAERSLQQTLQYLATVGSVSILDARKVLFEKLDKRWAAYYWVLGEGQNADSDIFGFEPDWSEEERKARMKIFERLRICLAVARTACGFVICDDPVVFARHITVKTLGASRYLTADSKHKRLERQKVVQAAAASQRAAPSQRNGSGNQEESIANGHVEPSQDVAQQPGHSADENIASGTEEVASKEHHEDSPEEVQEKAIELLSLVIRVWLLTNETRAVPPKQSGKVLDEWIRTSVEGALDYAKRFVASSGDVSNARKVLIESVENATVNTSWIVSDDVDVARNDYLLWEPPLKEIEWRAERRVLVGIKECVAIAIADDVDRNATAVIPCAKQIATRAALATFGMSFSTRS